ncbi:hypothetical protein ABEB36_002994 [Hypothenemus hampei]|uniref:Uncharacterized protein n=1 Tax=Hypothenemus hampei TaxID=57062 RepID=A0ABD1F7M6_HYPHA
MFQPASVYLSGPAFSFLLYETSKSTIRQNGFLLGDIVHKEITTITDNEQKQVDISKIIKINSVIPCSSNHYFSKGRVDKDKLQEFLGSNFSKVVAWYKYEPSSTVKFTLKDRALHKQFRELFTVPQDLFSVCFLLMESADNYASYYYQQTFMRYHNGNFDKISLCIPNLSEPNNSYKTSEPASETFNEILSSITMDIENVKGVVAITEIGNAVQKSIDKTVSELTEAEKQLFDLEEEVKILRKKQPLNNRSDVENVNEVHNCEELSRNKDSSILELIENSPESKNKSTLHTENETASTKTADISKEVKKRSELPKTRKKTKARGQGRKF